MKAITLTAPWAWAVAHAGKDVENRKTRCPSLLGETIAIHAGVRKASTDILGADAEFLWMKDRGLIASPPMWAFPGLGYVAPHGRIVAVATIVGWVDGATNSLTHGERHAGEAVFHAGAESKWFVGPVGWLLHDVRTIATPITARGKQGIWTVDAEAEARILAQIGGA